MGGEIGRIYVTLGAKDEMSKAIEGASKKLKDIGPTMEALAKKAAIGFAAVSGAVALMVKQTANAGDAFYDLSQKTGIGTKTLSAFKLAADQSGTSIEGFSVGMRGLSRIMGEALQGGKEAVDTFRSLGVEFMTSDGQARGLEETFLDVAARFASMEDGAEKTALAMKLFGRSGMDLIPMLNLGREGLKASADQARRLGIVFSEEAAAACDKFNDSLTELGGAFAGLRNTVAIELIPIFTKLVEGATEGLAIIRSRLEAFAKSGKLGEWAVSAAKVFIGAFKLMAQAVEGLLLLFPSLKAAVFSVAEGFYNVLSKIADAMSLLPGSAGAASLSLKVISEDLKSFAANYGAAAEEAIDKASDIVASFDSIYAGLKAITGALDDTDKASTKAAKNATSDWDAATRAFGSFTAQFVAYRHAIAEVIPTREVAPELPGGRWQTVIEGQMKWLGLWKDTTEKARSYWDDFADGLRTKWASVLGDAFQGLFGLTGAEKERMQGLRDALAELSADYKAGEISLEEYSKKYQDIHKEMSDITNKFAKFWKGIWSAIKTQFFDMIGQMVAKFLTGFVMQIISGMNIIKAATSAWSALGTAASGVASTVGQAGASAAGAAATLGATLGTAITGGFLAVVGPGLLQGFGELLFGSKPKSAEQLASENAWIDALVAKYKAQGLSNQQIQQKIQTGTTWWMSEPGTRGSRPGGRWATGFSGVITQPTTATFAESGPEFVSAVPLSGAGAGAAGGMISMNFYAPIITTTGLTQQECVKGMDYIFNAAEMAARKRGFSLKP